MSVKRLPALRLRGIGTCDAVSISIRPCPRIEWRLVVAYAVKYAVRANAMVELCAGYRERSPYGRRGATSVIPSGTRKAARRRSRLVAYEGV